MASMGKNIKATGGGAFNLEKPEYMALEITDHTCTEGEAYIFYVPSDISFHDIQIAVSVLYPEATSVTIRELTEEESKGIK